MRLRSLDIYPRKEEFFNSSTPGFSSAGLKFFCARTSPFSFLLFYFVSPSLKVGISLGFGVVFVEIWAALPDPDHQAGIFPSADKTPRDFWLACSNRKRWFRWI